MSTVRLTHVGGPTVLLEVDGWRILTDPTFDPPGRTYRFGWGTSSRKLTGPAVAAEQIGQVDVVLLSHDHHADNLDTSGRAVLARAGTVLTTVPAARRLGGTARGMRSWDTQRLEAPRRPTITVTATPCRHGPPGSRLVAGVVLGFSLAWVGQEHGELWMSGDTVLYRGVRQVADRLDVGTAILHLGAVRFPTTGPLTYSMSGQDAVTLCRAMTLQMVVPVHYEGWSHFSQGRASVERELAETAPGLTRRILWAPIGSPVEIAA